MASTDFAGSCRSSSDIEVAGVRIYGSSRLILFDDDLEGLRTISIGRTRQRSIRVRDSTISRLHCRIRQCDDGTWEIVDCASRNGVYVSPCGRYTPFRRIDSHPLHLGMQIRLGDVTIVPVDRAGASPIVARRQSEFVREADACYGSANAAAECVGMSRRLFYRILAGIKKWVTRSGTDD